MLGDAKQTCADVKGEWTPEMAAHSSVCDAVVASTAGKNCDDWCKAHDSTCLRGQDNKNGCELDASHGVKEDNGCKKNYGDQICQCGEPAEKGAGTLCAI